MSIVIGTISLLSGSLTSVAAAERRPSILVITIDALRADHLGCYGYGRDTSPNIDALIESGTRFERAWTPEPLTAPAMCSMLTGLYPHQHAASRNGLRMREGLASLPKTLAANGYTTAAFVGAWPLKSRLTRLGEHFDTYGERLKNRRWFGLVNSESSAEDLTDDALAWLAGDRENEADKPFFLWAHYIEPHAPYKFHREYADRLGFDDDKPTKIERYDTEIAAADFSVARLLEGVRRTVDGKDLLVVISADHGESLGEHNYWGHGRYLYEASLRIPLGVVWEGVVARGTVKAQASLIDLAPTILDLVGVEIPEGLPGTSWAQALQGGAEPDEIVGCYQAHRGAVYGGGHDSDTKRSKGLLWVGVIEGDRKEMIKVSRQLIQRYDLGSDPAELENLAPFDAKPSDELAACLARVAGALGSLDNLATQKLDAETVEQLKALGYLE